MKQEMKKVFAKALAGLLIVSNLSIAVPGTIHAASAASFATVGGANETLYATISGIKDADVTAVSYSGTISGTLTGEDFTYLVRDYNGGVRIDIPGVKAGTYTLTVTTKNGTVTKSGINVTEQGQFGICTF